MNYWLITTGLGSVLVTGGLAVLIAIWLAAGRETKLCMTWCAAFFAAMLLVLISKIAFIGWGMGILSADFTGISGHATRAAAVFPLLFYLALQHATHWTRNVGVLVGVTVGIMVAISRVMLHAHSISEIASGWLLGGCVSFVVIRSAKRQILVAAQNWLLICCGGMLIGSTQVKPVATERQIVRLALTISGHAKPVTRENWKKHAGTP